LVYGQNLGLSLFIYVVIYLVMSYFIMKKLLVILTFAMLGCELHDLETPNAVVPATTDQNHLLSQITITVKGFSRSIHLQTFGDTANPPVFVLHGGPGGDFRLMLPLKALADQYFVVMWDSRGAGLSERVTKEELMIDSFVEEVAQIKAAFSPNSPVILIGHSFGGKIKNSEAVKDTYRLDYLDCVNPIEPIDGWYKSTGSRFKLGVMVGRPICSNIDLQLELGSWVIMQKQGLIISFAHAQVPAYFNGQINITW
jgi:hypothetical protein